ncbi:MAG TPA: cytochrome c [Planctomycetota bacterium]|nr:cytochrome c [Planctomycetota bacterium]
MSRRAGATVLVVVLVVKVTGTLVLLAPAGGVLAHKPITSRYTFYRDILPVLESHCARCHRAGGAAPMAFSAFEEAKPWADAMKAQVLERAMPPWFAEKGLERLVGENVLTAREIDRIADWASGGAPAGARDNLAPRPVPGVSSPGAGTAEGDVRLYPLGDAPGARDLDLGLEEDRFLIAWSVEPGGVPRAHAARLRFGRALPLTWTAGGTETRWPAGAGLRLEARSRVEVELLRGGLTLGPRTGAAAKESILRLVFARGRPALEVRSVLLGLDGAPLPRGSRILGAFPETPASAGALLLVGAASTGSPGRMLLVTGGSRPLWPLTYLFEEPPEVLEGEALRWAPEAGGSGPLIVHWASRER